MAEKMVPQRYTYTQRETDTQRERERFVKLGSGMTIFMFKISCLCRKLQNSYVKVYGQLSSNERLHGEAVFAEKLYHYTYNVCLHRMVGWEGWFNRDYKKATAHWVQWLRPVIPTLQKADHLMSGVRDQPGQHGETLSLLKIPKFVRCGGTHLQSQILRRLRQEKRLNLGGRGCSEQRSGHCTLAWMTELECSGTVSHSLLQPPPPRLKRSPASTTRIAGTQGKHHHTQLIFNFL
ncbi:hypothetical protein AAY473_016660 [Plecturocebus cupreus]